MPTSVQEKNSLNVTLKFSKKDKTGPGGKLRVQKKPDLQDGFIRLEIMALLHGSRQNKEAHQHKTTKNGGIFPW